MIVSTWREFFAEGAGALMWTREDGKRKLLARVPCSGEKVGPVTISIFTERSPTNWAEEGEILGWDGNEEAPTLSPSVAVPGCWHGFIVAGVMCMDQRGKNPVRADCR